MAARATYVRPYVRTSRKGVVGPVRGHRRGTSMEFVPARRPVVENVRLYRRGENLPMDINVALSGPSAFVTLPMRKDDHPANIAPKTIYIVSDYSPDELRALPRVKKNIEKRWADILGHEALHLALHKTAGPKTARALDVPYGRYKRATGGDMSRGV